MEIRVRELLAFIKANPRLEEYDSPIAIAFPVAAATGNDPKSHVEIELKGLSLDQSGRLSLCLDVDTEGKFCSNCTMDLESELEKAKDKIKALEDAKSARDQS